MERDRPPAERGPVADLEQRVARLEQEVAALRAGVVDPSRVNPIETAAAAPSPPVNALAASLPPFARSAHAGHPADHAAALDSPVAKRAVLATFLDRRPAAINGRNDEPTDGDHAVGRRSTASDRDLLASRIERALGGRWYALIGAVIVLIGLALFLKLAVDQGWLRLTPAARCAGVALAGVALLGAGEWMLRRLSRAASAGFSAAGVGTLLASVWAAHRLYNLTGSTTAFILMSLACATGVVVAARAHMASVAVVSLIGAYLNPLLVGDASPAMAGFFAYLLMVLIFGLVLPAWKGRRFFAVRVVVWWGTLLIGGLPAAGLIRRDVALSPLIFSAAAWALIHAELAFSSRRRSRGAGDPGDGVAFFAARSPAVNHVSRATAPWRRWRSVVTSFVVTAWAALLMTGATEGLMPGHGWLAPAVLAAILLTAAHVLSGHLRFLTDIPRWHSERLGAAMAVQSGAMLILAVALAFSGSAAVVAWLAMGVAAVAAGRWLRARSLDAYGLVLLLLGTVRLAVYEPFFGVGRGAVPAALGLTWGPWMVLALCSAIAWAVAAWLVRRDASAPWRVVSHSVLGIGLTVAGLSPALGARAHGVLALAALVALAAIFAGSRLASAGLGAYGAVILGVAAVAAPFAGCWSYPADHGWTVAGLVLTPWTSTMLLLAASGASLRLQSFPGRSGAALRVIGSLGLVTVLLMVPVHVHASAASISMCWLGLGVATIAAARCTPWKELRLLAGAVAIFAVTAWLLAYSPWKGRWPADVAPALLSGGLWTGLVLAAGLAGIAWADRASLRVPDAPSDHARSMVASTASIMVAASCLVLWIATSMEAGRIGEILSNDRTVQRAAVSVWWGAFGLALISAGLLIRTAPGRGVPLARRVGLALVAVAVLKALVWDLAFVPAAARVFSFIGLGLLMMAVTVVYNKLSGRVDRAASPGSGPTSA